MNRRPPRRSGNSHRSFPDTASQARISSLAASPVTNRNPPPSKTRPGMYRRRSSGLDAVSSTPRRPGSTARLVGAVPVGSSTRARKEQRSIRAQVHAATRGDVHGHPTPRSRSVSRTASLRVLARDPIQNVIEAVSIKAVDQPAVWPFRVASNRIGIWWPPSCVWCGINWKYH